MNKLGFYVENTTVPFLRDALRQVKPPVMLVHAGDRTLLQQIRSELSPETFVIGRLFVSLAEQTAWLTGPDPDGAGTAFAERIINYDFQLAGQRGSNNRLLIDAWMSLNEPVRGPASFGDRQPDAETQARYAALDRFQVAFLNRMHNSGLEAVAFSFAAGNFTAREDISRWFPRTLDAYTYLALHEYGWPTMMPRTGTETACLYYRPVMDGIRSQHGDRHKLIITEAGLARMYKHANDPAGDVGWLYRGETVSEQQYWESLQWYNAEMVRDDYVMGGCLYQVGHAGLWETFRHLGVDNEQRPILLMDKIATLRTEPAPPPTPEPTPTPTPERLAELLARVVAVRQKMDAAGGQVDAFTAALSAARATLDGLAGATDGAPGQQEVQAILARLQQVEVALERLPGDTPLDVPALRSHAAALRAAAEQVLARVKAVGEFDARRQDAVRQALALDAQAAGITSVGGQAGALAAQAAILEAELRSETPPLTPAGQPPLRDVRTTLPVAPGSTVPQRGLSAIRRIIVHHTVTRDDVTPERLATAQIARGQDGITYHFLVTGDGTIHWTQPLEAVIDQTLVSQVNADGIGIALAGNFQAAAPTAQQLQAAAALIAWLLGWLGMPVNTIFGRNEVDSRVASPGAQWSQGIRYRDTLISAVTAIMAGAE